MEIALYEEVNLHIDRNKSEIHVSLPWLKGTIGVPDYADIDNDSNKSIVSILNDHQIFKHKSRWIFCYINPRSSQVEFPKKTHNQSLYDELDSPQSLLSYFKDHKLDSPYWKERFKHWSWDADFLLEKSQIDKDHFDPLTAYTVIRRFRNISKDRQETQHLSNVLEDHLNNDEPAFFGMTHTLLSQSYHVTSHCHESLQPAIEGFKEAELEVKEFIDEEYGHESFIKESLDEVPIEYREKSVVFPETKIAMKLLRRAAKEAPLAFCCLISHFEEPANYRADPMAELILKSSNPEIARGIATHFKINKQGNHHSVGIDFAKNLSTSTKKDLIIACRFAELLSMLFNGIAYRTLELWETKNA